MVVALSRFKVANGMEGEVARAFRERPRSVEQAPGFRWLEVFVDSDDPSVYYLLTRWSDRPSFEMWHRSPAHHESHAFIPKGLKLDASWTQVFHLTRLDGVTGSPLTEAIVDSPLLVGAFAAASADMHLFVLASDGTIRTCNGAACEELAGGEPLDGKSIFAYMPDADAARLRGLLAEQGRREATTRLNFAAPTRVPYTLECWLDVQRDRATLLGHPTLRSERQRQQSEFSSVAAAADSATAALSRLLSSASCARRDPFSAPAAFNCSVS